jgi:hypothetical protein
MNPLEPLMVVTWEYFPRGIITTTFSPALHVIMGLVEASIGIEANIGQSAVTVWVMSDSLSVGVAATTDAFVAGMVAAIGSDFFVAVAFSSLAQPNAEMTHAAAATARRTKV